MTCAENLIEKYEKKGGWVEYPIEDSVLLGFGMAICGGEGLKFAVIQEKYLNSWNSAYTIQMFNKLPKKYQNL